MFAFVCMYVSVLDLFLALWSRVDVDPSEEYQESPSEQFEQQKNFEEGKYNMNTTYHFKYIFIQHFNTVCL